MTTRRTNTTPFAAIVASAVMAATPVAQASDNIRYDDTTYGTMIVDAVAARPLGLGATVLGTAAWIVTLPFSALGGNINGAARELIVKPARFTFTRPLGEF